MPATSTRPPLFVAQLHRASAQRGKLDPLFQELSDHWTAILQRLYPVWALIGPGLSDPGHIEIHSRTIYLDSDELLRPRAQIADGRLEPRAILRCFGVALHETLHGKHTKRWAIEHDLALAASTEPADRQLASDRRLLEEPRMEAHGVRSFPADSVRGRFVRRALGAAVVDVILPRFAEQILRAALAGEPLSRDMAARAMVYLQARALYGIVDPRALGPLRHVWRQTLGAGDLQALDDLFARLVWIDDGDLEALDRAARAYREIVGAPDPPPSDQSGGDGTSGGAGSPGGGRSAAPTRTASARASGRSITRSNTRAPGSSSSSTRTSTSSSCSLPRRATATAPRAAAATAPACPPGGYPTAASTARHSRTRSSTPAATPRGCATPSPTAPARSTSAHPAGASTGAPTRAARPSAPPAGQSAPSPGTSPAGSARRSRPRTSD